MTPKEKAQELVKKYEDCYPKNYDKTGRNFFTDQIKISALIAVDEIIEAIDFDWMEVQNLEREHAYWQEVKQEIEKI